MLVKEVLEKTTQFFRDKKIESPRLDAELLLASSLNLKNRVDLYLKFETPLKDDELSRCREAVRRRSQGEPVAYIVGSKGFFGFDFYVDKNVLIPRPETEHLVEEGLKYLETQNAADLTIVDMGCGSGCIGLSLLKTIEIKRSQGKAFQKLESVTLVAVDKSIEALEVAKKNAESLLLLAAEESTEKTTEKTTEPKTQTELKAQAEKKFQHVQLAPLNKQITFVQIDLQNPLINNAIASHIGKVDLVLANPPYIDTNDINVEENVKKHEPNMALFSNDQGYLDLKLWSAHALQLLKPNGFCGFEMGKDQAAVMKAHFSEIQFQNIQIVKDLAGFDRHILGTKNG
jgi:release factor glutamine methyltransferase